MQSEICAALLRRGSASYSFPSFVSLRWGYLRSALRKKFQDFDPSHTAFGSKANAKVILTSWGNKLNKRKWRVLGGPVAAKGDRGESDLEGKKVLVDTSIYTKDNVPFKKKL